MSATSGNAQVTEGSDNVHRDAGIPWPAPEREPNTAYSVAAIESSPQLASDSAAASTVIESSRAKSSLSQLAQQLIAQGSALNNAQSEQHKQRPQPTQTAQPVGTASPLQSAEARQESGLPPLLQRGLAPVSAVPEGELDRDHLQWFRKSWYNKTIIVASLPAERLEDFVKGEGRKALTSWYKHKSDPARESKRGKAGAIVSKVSYRCTFGPEDHTQLHYLLTSSGSGRGYLPNGQPRKRTRIVSDRKRGCLACFDAVTYEGSKDIVEIRYSLKEHVNAAGRICHGIGFAEGGRAALAPNLSEEARQVVQEGLQAGQKHTEIVNRVKEGVAVKYQHAQGLASLEEAKKAIEAKGGFVDRDYLITSKDILNISTRMKDPTGDRHKKAKREAELRKDSSAEKPRPRVEMVILGNAQDAGLPQIMCKCGNCQAVREGKRSAEWPASLAIIDYAQQRFFVVDATPDFRHQISWLETRHPFFRLGGIFITHLHMGHYTGLLQLGKEGLNCHMLPLYCSKAAADFFKGTEPWKQLCVNKNIQLKIFPNPSQEEVLKNFAVVPVTVPHRSELSDTLAFRFRPYPPPVPEDGMQGTFYCPDTDGWQGWHKSPKDYLSGVAVAVIDATFYSDNELPGRNIRCVPHPLVTDTMTVLNGLTMAGRGPNGKRVVLTHLNHTNPLHAESQERSLVEDKGFLIAQLGMSWDLS